MEEPPEIPEEELILLGRFRADLIMPDMADVQAQKHTEGILEHAWEYAAAKTGLHISKAKMGRYMMSDPGPEGCAYRWFRHHLNMLRVTGQPPRP